MSSSLKLDLNFQELQTNSVFLHYAKATQGFICQCEFMGNQNSIMKRVNSFYCKGLDFGVGKTVKERKIQTYPRGKQFVKENPLFVGQLFFG